MSTQYKAYIRELVEELKIYYVKLYMSRINNPKIENISIDKLNKTTSKTIKNNVYLKAILVELDSTVFINRLIYVLLYITQNQEKEIYKNKLEDVTGITLTSQAFTLGKEIVKFYIKARP